VNALKIIALMVLVATNIFAQDDAIIKLFPGKWKMDVENVEVYEEWQLVNENELIGISYSIKDGVKNISENLYLKKFADQWAYVAVPKNQSIALFALIEYSPKKFLFENKEHDFPQKISYEFHKDGRMTATIEGDVNGKIKRKEFSFRIVEN
jgi:hypothetical protein